MTFKKRIAIRRRTAFDSERNDNQRVSQQERENTVESNRSHFRSQISTAHIDIRARHGQKRQRLGRGCTQGVPKSQRAYHHG